MQRPCRLLIPSPAGFVGSGEVALWRAVLEQALNDACLLRFNLGVNRTPSQAGGTSASFAIGPICLPRPYRIMPTTSWARQQSGIAGHCARWFGGLPRRSGTTPWQPVPRPRLDVLADAFQAGHPPLVHRPRGIGSYYSVTSAVQEPSTLRP